MPVRLSVQQLIVNFTAPEGETLPALGPLSLEIAAHEFVCVLGPSGCGKSTLIRVLAGLTIPSSGQVLADNKPIAEPSAKIGLMFQNANLMPWRTVIDNVVLPLELAGIDKNVRYATGQRLLTSLQLTEFAHAYPAELSGGMAQRAALGRLLAQEADVLLLDEPFGALDALTREKISLDLLEVWSQRQQTVVMVTHDIQEAVFLADRVVVLSRRPGCIVADIQVPLPRPRSIDLMHTDTFAQTTREVRKAIDRA